MMAVSSRAEDEEVSQRLQVVQTIKKKKKEEAESDRLPCPAIPHQTVNQ